MAGRYGRHPEGGSHRGPQYFRIHQLCAAGQGDHARRSESMGGADDRTDVAGILNPVEDQDDASP